jgi:hypothetical protein
MDNPMKKQLKILFCSICIFCFVMTEITEDGIVILNLTQNVFLHTVVYFGVWFLCRKMMEKKPEKKQNILFHVLALLISAFFSGATILGKFYENQLTNGWSYKKSFLKTVCSGSSGIIRLLLCFAGGVLAFYLFMQYFGYLEEILREKTEIKYSNILRSISEFLFGKFVFLKSFIILAVIWIPQMLIRYPGAIVVDTWVSWGQYSGLDEYTTQHPIIYTLLFGKFMDWGIAHGRINYGVFLLIVIQSAISLFAFAYTIFVMRKLDFPKWFCGISLILFAINPIFIAYATTAVIESLYLPMALVLIDQLVLYLYDRKKFFTIPNIILTVIAILGTFFRYNGIYIVLGTFAVILLHELYILFHRKGKMLAILFLCITFVCPLFAGKTTVNYLNKSHNSQSVSNRAMLALPIQQTVKCLIMHGDEITGAQYDAIHTVLTEDNEFYEEHYNPRNFDDVKGTFAVDATKEELVDFVKAWMQLVIKYPVTCIGATLNQTYYLFSPLAENQRYYTGMMTYADKGERYNFTDLCKENTALELKLGEYYYAIGRMPIISLLVNQGIWSLLLAVTCLYALTRKRGKILVLAMPLLLTLAIAIVAPAVLKNPRYAYLIIYAMPLYIGTYLYGNTNREN